MSAAQSFEIYKGTALAPATGVFPEIGSARREKHPANVILALDTVMFTGRVPLSTWTFTLSIADKLWVSDRTTLYFGKETRIHRAVYRDNIPRVGHRVDFQVGVAAYNNYGDVVTSVQPVRFYDTGHQAHPSALLHVEQNWMQLLFKFRLVTQEAEHL